MFQSLKSKREETERQERIAAEAQRLQDEAHANAVRNEQAGKADVKLFAARAVELREEELLRYGNTLETRIANETAIITNLEREAVDWRRHVEAAIIEAEHAIVRSRDTAEQLETGRRLSSWREVLRLSKPHLTDRNIEIDRHRETLKRDKAELTKTAKELIEVQAKLAA